MSRRAIIGMAALALMLAACSNIGSGNLITETRDVGDFDSIDVSAGINVELTVDPSADQNVTVTYDDNVIDDVVTRVSGDTLIIEYRTSFVGSIGGSGRVVEVTAPDLVDVDISGGADLTATGDVDSYRIDASGGADADLRDLEAVNVEVDASGGADVSVFATGTVEGDASGGSDVTVYGDPDSVLIDTSGGANVNIR